MELQEYLPKLLFIFCISAESGLDCIDLDLLVSAV